MFVFYFDRRLTVGYQQVIKFASRVAVQHKNLAEMSAGSPQKLQAVGLGFGQGLFVAKDNPRVVIFYSSQGNEALPLDWRSRRLVRPIETLVIQINGRLGILQKDPLFSPIEEIV